MAGLSPALRRILGMADEVAAGSDDVIDTIRAAKLAREAEAADFLRKMQGEEMQWQSRFGFDKDRLFPKDTNVQIAGRRMDMGAPLDPNMSLGSPSFDALYKAAGQFDQLRTGRMANLRNQNPDLVRIAASQINEADDAARAARIPSRADAAKGAGAAALGAAGVGLMLTPTPIPSEPEAEELTETGNPAELREEPVSTAAPEAPPRPAAPQPTDYAYEARQILQKLNAMRRAAGGEVPEAQAMIAEANKLLAMSDQQRNAPGYEPAMPTDYHGQATMLIQQLNQMRRQAGGEVPQAPQMMAEIRRLQAMGDKQRWSN